MSNKSQRKANKKLVLSNMKDITDAVKQKKAFRIVQLEELHIYFDFDGSHQQQLLDALKIECSIRVLHFGYGGAQGDIKLFCEILTVNKSVQKMDVTMDLDDYYYGVSEDGAILCQELAHLLTVNSTLTDLSVSGCIGSAGCGILSKGLLNNNTLKTLNVADNLINEDIGELTEVLKQNNSLTNLNLQDNLIGTNGLKLLGDVFICNKTLSTLSIQNMKNITDEGFNYFFDVLKNNEGLTDLTLAGIEMKPNICTALADLIKTNQALTCLDISWCGLGCDGISIISEGLKHNQTLLSLYLGNNKIGVKGCQSLSEVLAVNESIHELDLSLNKIDGDACKYLCDALKRNKTVSTLNLFMNKIGDEGCKWFSEAIAGNGCLMTLNLLSNDIGNGCKDLLEGLKKNSSLTDINITYSHEITQEIQTEIINTFQRNKITRKTTMTNIITSLINIARRPESLDVLPFENWLRIFKHVYCSGISRFDRIAHTIFTKLDLTDLASVAKLRIVRHRGRVDLA